jgi:protease I
MKLKGKKIGILVESDYVEYEIYYYKFRFAEEGADVHFLTRLWGQPSLTFVGHEWQAPFTVSESFEDMDDETLRSYSAIIVPGGMLSDRLRYTEDIKKLPPATEFLKRAFAEKSVLKGVNCHGMWLLSLAPELVRDRPIVCHTNLLGDVRNMGAIYTDQDVVVDGDLVTGRSAGHCAPFATEIIERIAKDDFH